MNHPSKLWKFCILFAGFVGLTISVIVSDGMSVILSVLFTLAIWIIFGKIEADPELKKILEKRLK